jgi:hypothetical protein
MTQPPLFVKDFLLLPPASRAMQPAKAAPGNMLALSPSWTQQLGAGGATQVLRDSTTDDAWGRLTGWIGTMGRRLPAQRGVQL